MKIYVIRHGITPLNIQKKVNGEIDEPLASEGIEQVKTILPFIPRTITTIYSSTLLRARQTADIISSQRNSSISYHDALSEIHMGSLAGKAWEEMEEGINLKKKHRTVLFDYRPFGGESVEDVKKRLIPFLKKIKKTHKENEVLLITHGGIIRIMHLLEKGVINYDTQKHVSLITIDLEKILQKV